jgi:GGDEF domain-containing protein
VPARPVADAPVAALTAAPDALARDWLVALLARAPLDAAAAIPVAELAREAPGLCAAMARALASDLELERLSQGDLHALAARAGMLAGASDPAAVVEAVEVLRGVLWAAALAELRRPEPGLVAALADRLAAVAAVVSAAAVRAGAPTRPAVWPAVPAGEVPAAEPLHVVPDPPRWDPTDAARTVQQAADGDAVHVRDLRPRILDGSALEHIAQRVADHEADRRTLAVLLVELDGIERLLAAGDDAVAATHAAEHAVEGLLRQGDGARRDGPGRVWITLPGTGPAGARALALRIAVAVERAAEHRGAPLTVSSGIAVFPTDALDAEGLADHAEEALLRARAGGVR